MLMSNHHFKRFPFPLLGPPGTLGSPHTVLLSYAKGWPAGGLRWKVLLSSRHTPVTQPQAGFVLRLFKWKTRNSTLAFNLDFQIIPENCRHLPWDWRHHERKCLGEGPKLLITKTTVFQDLLLRQVGRGRFLSFMLCLKLWERCSLWSSLSKSPRRSAGPQLQLRNYLFPTRGQILCYELRPSSTPGLSRGHADLLLFRDIGCISMRRIALMFWRRKLKTEKLKTFPKG